MSVLPGSGEVNISCNNGKNGVDFAELMLLLLGVNKGDVINSVQLKMVWLMWLILLWCCSQLFFSNAYVSTSIRRSSCTTNDLTSKTFNNDGHSLIAVFRSRSMDSYVILCKHCSDLSWQKMHCLLLSVSMEERSNFCGNAFVVNFRKILLPFFSFF